MLKGGIIVKKRLFLNEDSDNFGYFCHQENLLPDESLIDGFIDYYADSGVTDFVLNLNCAVSTTESAVFDSFIAKYEKTEEFGAPVNYKDTFLRVYYHIARVLGIDLYGRWIDRLKMHGIRPWLSFRMNDCHHNDFCYNENNKPEWSTTAYRSPFAWFDITLDYSQEPVREAMFNYIKEQTARYDVYGIELDFDREPYCFPAGKKAQGRAIITEFVAQVRAFLDELGKQRGHRIQLSLLCQANPIDAYENGFDIAAITRRHLVDLVVACPRWETINNDIPVGVWKQLIPDDVDFACKQELLVRSYPSYRAWHFPSVSTAHSLGQASAFESMGTDVTYLFNYMYKYFSTAKPSEEDAIRIVEGSAMSGEAYLPTLRLLADTDNYRTHPLRFPLTYNDFGNLYNKTAPRLPQTVEGERAQLMRIVTGRIDPDRRCYLIIETSEAIDPATLTVFANGIRATYIPDGKEDRAVFKERVYTFAFDCEIDDCVEFDLLATEPCTVEYMEVLAE